MRAYLTDKIVAVGVIVFLCSVVSWLIEPTNVAWQYLIICTVIAGFTHYGLGGYYQWRGIRKRNNRLEKKLFVIISAMSVIGAATVIYFLGTPTLVFLTLFYFILHGYFNEITLYERQTTQTASRALVIGVMGIFLGSLLYGIGHPSWFFTPSLEFLSLTPVALAQFLQTYQLMTVAQALGVLCFIVAALGVGYGYAQQRNVARLLVAVLICTSIGLSLYFQPLPYVYLLVSILLYHFIVWFLFYLRLFAKQSQAAQTQYLVQHALIIIAAVVLAAMFTPALIFNMNSFLILTTWHITASFLNEPWVQARLG